MTGAAMTEHDAFEATEIVDASGKAYKFVRAVLTDHGDIGRADEILTTAQRIAAAAQPRRGLVCRVRVDEGPADGEPGRVAARRAMSGSRPRFALGAGLPAQVGFVAGAVR
jgi:hypothetical protein